MAISKLNFNSLNVTPTASKGIGFDSGADDLEATFSGGSMTFIKKLTASSSATLSFVDGASGVTLDNSFKEYLFTFKDIHPQNSGVNLEFNFSTDGGSNYNVTKTTTFFTSAHSEDNTSEAQLEYRTGQDLAQSTAFQPIHWNIDNNNDDCNVGTLQIFNPSSTTFVKHFIATTNISSAGATTKNHYVSGYGNTTSAVNAIRFQMSSGNIDAGDITLYGIN